MSRHQLLGQANGCAHKTGHWNESRHITNYGVTTLNINLTICIIVHFYPYDKNILNILALG